jgi:peroxiredoxin
VIEVGAAAPSFELPNQDGETVSLEDYSGRKLILAFYPADFSEVCTDQLSIYQEVLDEIEARGASLVGISVDGVFCHKAFQEKLGITFPLLSDFHPKGEVCRAYGALIEKRGHANRSLVLIDEQGTVAYSMATPTPLEIPGANVIFDALDGLTTSSV